MSLITRGVDRSKTKSDEKEGHKKKIRKLVDPLVGLPSELDFQIRLLVDEYHEWFTSVAHYAKVPTERQYRRKLAEMEEVLLKIMRPHFDVIAEIDRILENEKPSASSFKRMEELIARDLSCYDHFFRKASGEWLPFLIKGGYFAKPQHLIREKNEIRYGFIPPSAYLARVAEEKSAEVLKLLLSQEIPKREERNPIVLENFVIAATKIQSKYARRIAQKISKERWMDVAFFSGLDEKIADLMVKLSNDGYHKDAAGLAQSLLDVKLSEPHLIGGLLEDFKMVKRVMPLIDDYSYGEIARSKLPILAKNDAKSVINVLVFLLNKSIFLENVGADQKDSQSDTSVAWRPAIEANRQNEHFDFRSVLVDILRGAMESEGKIDIHRLKKHFRIISEKKYPIFRRFEIHIYRMFPSAFQHKIEQVMIADFDRSEFHHEYYLLLSEAFPLVSEKARQKFLELVEKGPDNETIEYWKKRQMIYPDETVEVKTKVWTFDKLHPIARFLEGELKKRYEQMQSELGEPEHPDFHIWHSGVMSGEPKTELADNLGASAVINFVRSYKMNQQSDFPFYDGTSQKFKEYVEKNPLEYSKLAEGLKTADETFCYSLLSGLENSIKSGKEVCWQEPLALCKHLLDSTKEDGEQKRSHNILGAIANLIEEGLKSQKVSPPFSLREDVWKLLTDLIPLGNSEEHMEEDYPERNWDAVGVSINTTSGKTFHAIMQYALWCNSHLKKDNKPEFAPEVISVLEDYFAKKINNTVSRHAVLGWQFPNLIYLNRNWTVNNLSKIFPEHDIRLARAAWDAYLCNTILPWAFREVINHYSSHIENLKNPVLSDGRLTSFDQHLIEHIYQAYTHDLKNSEALFQELVKTGNDLVLQHCAWVVSRILKHYKESPYKSLNLESIRKIWKNESLSRQKEADWWFTYSPFDKVETIDLFLESLRKTGGEIGFASTVETHLESYASDFPSKTAECLELILKSEKNRSTLYAVRRTAVKRLLQALLQSKDRRAVKKAEHLIHFLGSLGLNEFGGLLK